MEFSKSYIDDDGTTSDIRAGDADTYFGTGRDDAQPIPAPVSPTLPPVKSAPAGAPSAPAPAPSPMRSQPYPVMTPSDTGGSPGAPTQLTGLTMRSQLREDNIT